MVKLIKKILISFKYGIEKFKKSLFPKNKEIVISISEITLGEEFFSQYKEILAKYPELKNFRRIIKDSSLEELEKMINNYQNIENFDNYLENNEIERWKCLLISMYRCRFK